MHTRQHKAGKENAVNAITFCVRLLKSMKEDMALCTCCRRDVLKQTMAIDAPGTIRGTVEWSIPLENSLSTN